MCILFICFAELQRGFSCRALRESVFKIGYFTNRVMAFAIPISILLCVLIANVPGVMDEVFKLEYISGREWGFIIALSVIPFIVDELTKLIYRRYGFHKRPTAVHISTTAAQVAPLPHSALVLNSRTDGYVSDAHMKTMA